MSLWLACTTSRESMFKSGLENSTQLFFLERRLGNFEKRYKNDNFMVFDRHFNSLWEQQYVLFMLILIVIGIHSESNEGGKREHQFLFDEWNSWNYVQVFYRSTLFVRNFRKRRYTDSIRIFITWRVNLKRKKNLCHVWWPSLVGTHGTQRQTQTQFSDLIAGYQQEIKNS